MTTAGQWFRPTEVNPDAPVRPPLFLPYSGPADPLVPPGAMESWASRTPDHLGDSGSPGDRFSIGDPGHAPAGTTGLTRHVHRRLALLGSGR